MDTDRSPPTEGQPPPSAREALLGLGLSLDSTVLPRLDKFLELLLEANRRINLTAVRQREAAWHRHIVDSLTLLPHLKAGSRRLVDVGSGGGVPGIPLAIAQPGLEVMLVEATRKKAAFLESACRSLALSSCGVVAERAEAVGHHPSHRGAYDVAVCRAIGPMREIVEYLLPLVRIGGVAVAFKGPAGEGEIDAARDAVAVLGGRAIRVESAYPPAANHGGTLVFIDKAGATPPRFPRAEGTPKRSPL